MKILSFVFPGFTFLDLAAPMQAFMMLPEAKSQIVWQKKGIVACDAGVHVQATEDFHSSWKDPDILFVPGNTLGLFKQLQDDRTLDFLADVGSRAAWVTSVCNGSLLLGAAGLLKGYRAASHWYTREQLSLFGAIPTDARYVIDRNRATGGGMTAGLDFGIAMVGSILGEPAGRILELSFEYAPQPPFGTGRPELADPDTLAAATKTLKELMPIHELEGIRDHRFAKKTARRIGSNTQGIIKVDRAPTSRTVDARPGKSILMAPGKLSPTRQLYRSKYFLVWYRQTGIAPRIGGSPIAEHWPTSRYQSSYDAWRCVANHQIWQN